MTCQIVPPYLLEQLSSDAAGDVPSGPPAHTLEVDERFRSARAARTPGAAPVAGDESATGRPAWTVHTAANGTDLPGTRVRAAGEAASGDPAVDEAAYGITGSLALFAEVYRRA